MPYAARTPQAAVALLLLGATAVSATIFLTFGILHYPGMHEDGDMFLPATMNVGAGVGWIIKGYTPLLMRAKDSELYNNHGFLMPLIVGKFFQSASMSQIYIISGITNSLAACLYTWLSVRRTITLTFQKALYGWMLGIMAGVIGIFLQGRPEQLALLIIPLPLIISLVFKNGLVLFHVTTIVTIASLSALSPLLGLYYWIGHSVALLRIVKNKIIPYLKLQVITISGSCLCFAIAIAAMTPFNILILINQILNYSKSPYVHGGYNLLALGNQRLQAPFWQLPLLIVIIGSIHFLVKKRQFLPMIVLAIPILLLAKLSGPYLYMPFAPLCLYFIHQHLPSLRSPLWMHLRPILFLFLSLYLLIFARYAVLDILYMKGSTQFQTVKVAVSQLQVQAHRLGGEVGYAKAKYPSFVVFSEPGSELIAVRANAEDWGRMYYEKTRKKQIKFIVVSQEGQMDSVPDPFIDEGRFKLIINKWSNRKARFMGIRLGGYEPGYPYAVYERVSP